ncbi:ABC transporter family substrate-binding protein [Microbacterium sp. p3-SID338]|uniref:ABC transporter family substrate-binding protein n=1 Tax=unclassified Microbacterium TaxID=2609290 RepID=UPI00078930D6|nr:MULTISPECIES: ABC transporter family substrate-binding protein [unclassified Microbacterium]KYJ98905.1 ABC transporter substrate-binding protein [Microbacterium sp. CH1]MCT1396223.1 ABC transporter family substrate-binding protein [Microbacterium sp. p3-SID338]PMC02351.1 ABC transporter substrate-binding protein [Microbacterium sp. UMB0228]
MKNKKLLGAVAVGGALALALAGCASGSGNNGGGDNGGEKVETKTADYNPQDRSNLQEGGEVNFPINEIPEQLNAFNGDGSADTVRLWSWYMPQILLVSPEGEVTKNDAYLDTYEIGEKDGNTTITFTFTDEAHFNDGTDMDWTAVDATWKANRSYEEGFTPNATDGYKQIKSVEQGDTAKTAVVTFDGIYAWPSMAFLTGGVLHPAAADPTVFNEGFIGNMHPEWGAGPYTVDTFDANGGFVSFKPNPEWWGNAPLLDSVTFTAMEPDAAVNAFKNGEIDMVGANTNDRLKQVQDVEDTTVRRAQQTAKTILMVDADKPQFEDIDVRKAFFLGVNIDQQKQIAWNGLGYDEPVAGSLNLYSFQDGYEDSFATAGLKHDVDAAKKLLDDAGWTEGEDGIREKDGEKLSVTFPVFGEDPTLEALAKSLQAQQKEIGIDLKIDVRASADFSNDLTSKNWDVVSLRFTDSDPFGPAWFCQLYCSDSQLNLSSTSTPEIDKQIADEVESQKDAESWTSAAMELEPKIVEETWGVIPLYSGPSIYVVKNGLANLTPEPYVGLDLFGVTPIENVGWEK